jgi:hypothetical protein
LFYVKSDKFTLEKNNYTLRINQSMEVHYLPSPNRASRPIKDYFIEFIFIFLAVTLALYVEHYRESEGEKAKTKEFARLVYDDLKIDAANLQRTIDEKSWLELKYDSLIDILAIKNVREYNEFIYYAERYVTKSPVFESRDITYEPLQNAGTKKDINDIKLKKDIASYNALYKQYRTYENAYITSESNNLAGIEPYLFDPDDLTSLDNPNTNDFRSLVLRPGSELQPIRRNTAYLKLFYIKVNNANKHTKLMKELLEKQKVLGLNLMKNLEKYYNLNE